MLEILRTFTKQELIKFEDFVRSPYFNRKDTVTKLFIEIKKYAPEFSSENLEKEKIWKKLFPGKEYNYGIMKNIIFDLDSLAESFVVDLKFKKDRLKYDEYVLNIFLERGLNRSFNNRYNSISRTMSAYPEGLSSINITEYSDFMTRILDSKVSYHNVFENIKMKYDIVSVRDSFFISRLIVTLLGAYNDFLVFQYWHNAFLLYDAEKIDLFAKQFISKLDPEYTESMQNHIKFLTSFINKHYDEALNYLSLIDIPIISMKISVRMYKALCMYEINNYEMFLNEFDNLKHFIRNNEYVSDNAKKKSIRFYTFIDRLFNQRQAFDRYDFMKLKDDLREETQYKVWLCLKLEEIEKAKLK